MRVLQAVGYGTYEAEDGDTAPADQNGSSTGGRFGSAGNASLEAALLAKARRLEHVLTMARLKIAEISGAN